MRRALLSILLLLMAGTTAAQNDAIRITWPPPVYDVAGTFAVRGTVNLPDLQSYFLEVALLDAGDPLWFPVTLPVTTPVSDGVLGEWMTALLPDGIYQLRLHVLLRSGERVFFTVWPLRIANNLDRPEGESPIVRIVPPTPAPPTAEPPPQQLEPTRVPRPNPVNRLPVPLGGHVNVFGDAAQNAMNSAGMTWVKWQVPFIIGEDNLINVARDRIERSHAAGFNVLLSITGEAEALGELGDDYYPVYAEFLARVAELGPDAIEVWNEMNLDREWPRGRINPSAYADMLEAAFTAIKAADPQVMVISGALAPTGAEGAFGSDRVWNDDRYYLGMANAGVANFADCIGVHYNEGIIAPVQQGGDPRGGYPTYYFPLMINRAAFPFRNFDVPFCFTELGYLSPEGYGPLPGGFAWAANTSLSEQAAWMRDAIELAGADGRIDLIIIWNVDFDRYDDDPQAGYAIIRADGSCPACSAIASLQR